MEDAFSRKTGEPINSNIRAGGGDEFSAWFRDGSG
jgi:hypothetical protein